MGDNAELLAPFLIDTLQLPAATCLRITSGSEDWLSGKYVSANWDLDVINSEWKEKILASNGLVSKLAIPK